MKFTYLPLFLVAASASPVESKQKRDETNVNLKATVGDLLEEQGGLASVLGLKKRDEAEGSDVELDVNLRNLLQGDGLLGKEDGLLGGILKKREDAANVGLRLNLNNLLGNDESDADEEEESEDLLRRSGEDSDDDESMKKRGDEDSDEDSGMMKRSDEDSDEDNNNMMKRSDEDADEDEDENMKKMKRSDSDSDEDEGMMKKKRSDSDSDEDEGMMRKKKRSNEDTDEEDAADEEEDEEDENMMKRDEADESDLGLNVNLRNLLGGSSQSSQQGGLLGGLLNKREEATGLDLRLNLDKLLGDEEAGDLLRKRNEAQRADVELVANLRNLLGSDELLGGLLKRDGLLNLGLRANLNSLLDQLRSERSERLRNAEGVANELLQGEQNQQDAQQASSRLEVKPLPASA